MRGIPINGFGPGRGGGDQGGKIDPENAAMANLAGGFDPAFMLLRDSIDRGQPQSHALADLFSGEEGLEGVFERALVHAPAGVSYRETHEQPRPCLGVGLRGCRVQLHQLGVNGQAAAAWHHRIPRIDAQVGHHLFDHANIGLNPKRSVPAGEVDCNGFAHQLLQRLAQAGQHLV